MKKSKVIIMLSMVVSLNTSAQKTLTPEVKKDLIELSSTFIDAYIAAAREIATIKSKFILVESGAIMYPCHQPHPYFFTNAA